jgi:hypothetical protein
MLHDFLTTNRSELIERCRVKVSQRRAPRVTPAELEHGIPLFLDQLTNMLPGGSRSQGDTLPYPANPQTAAEAQIEDDASKHGRELLRHDFTIDQVVHDYGDLCQAITQLADEQRVEITPHEFGTLNIRLDNAIAVAVTEFARRASNDEDAAAPVPESLHAIAHEMRNLHTTMSVAIKAIERGTVGFGGATSEALKTSLATMGKLIDRVIQLGHPPPR